MKYSAKYTLSPFRIPQSILAHNKERPAMVMLLIHYDTGF